MFAPQSGESAERAERIDAYLVAAEQAFEAGDYDGAIESCKQMLMLDDSDERPSRNSTGFTPAIDEQQAQADLAARAQEEDDCIRADVDAARRRFANGEHQAALQSLDALEPASHPLVESARKELAAVLRGIDEERRAQAAHADRRRRAAQFADQARAALHNDRPEEAARLIEVLRELDDSAPELPELAERLQRAQAAAQLDKEIERILGDFDEQLTQRDLGRAGDVLQAAVSLASTDPRVLRARLRLEQATAAREAKAAAEAQKREAERTLDEAVAHIEKGDLTLAADVLTLATATLTPQHSGVVRVSDRLREATARQAAAEAAERVHRQIAELVASASQRLQSAGNRTSELALALRDVKEALASMPGTPKLRASRPTSRNRSRRSARPRASRRSSTTHARGSRTANTTRRSVCSRSFSRRRTLRSHRCWRNCARRSRQSRNSGESNASASRRRSAWRP